MVKAVRSPTIASTLDLRTSASEPFDIDGDDLSIGLLETPRQPKPRTRWVRSVSAKTRERVSCDGTLPSSRTTRQSQSIWAYPKASTATNVSAPLVTAQRVSAKMSASARRRLCSRHGSETAPKCPSSRDKAVAESGNRSHAAQTNAINPAVRGQGRRISPHF